jgi:F0F1-type ATP synthase assembly protein I
VNLSGKSTPDSRKELFRTALISTAGSVGCLTVVVILGAILGGIWLDSHFGTKPTWTITLALVSVPLSVLVMIVVVRAIIKRIQSELDKDRETKPSEENLSRGS